MSFVFAPPPQAVIPVQDERYEFFPVRRVYCIARNYRAPGEALLAAGEKLPEPIFFMKPADAVVPVADGETLALAFPPRGENLRPELELVACLSKGGANLTLEEAEAAIWGWCVGIDFARGDLQDESKKHGRPWETAKVFDNCAPVTHVRPAYRAPMPAPADVYFYVGNEKRQSGNTSQMLRSPAEVIAALSTYFTLEPGDIVFTGTPAGVAPVKRGDRLMGGVNGVGQIKVDLV